MDQLLVTGFNLEHAVLFLRHILLRDQWLIERLSEAMGAALVGNNFSPTSIPSKISFQVTVSHEKKVTAAWPTSCKGFIASRISAETVWSLNFFKSVTGAEFETSEVRFLVLMPQTGKILLAHCNSRGNKAAANLRPNSSCQIHQNSFSHEKKFCSHFLFPKLAKH